jgi:plastocyanin
MKKKLLLLATIFMTAATSFAVTYTIHVGSMAFTPSAITVNPGDVVTWVWDNGTHTTTSSLVPIGAATWDKPITSEDPTYSYIPSVLGTYNYQCTFHFTLGMIGTIYVVDPHIAVTESTGPTFKIFPSPASDIIHLQLSQSLVPASVSLTDITGRQVMSRNNVTISTDIDLQNISNGSYIISVQQRDAVRRQSIVVTH